MPVPGIVPGRVWVEWEEGRERRMRRKGDREGGRDVEN